MSALPDNRLAWRPLGEILVERGLISQLELRDALRDQQHEGGRLGEILFARGLVSAIDLRDALAEQHGLDLRVESRTAPDAPHDHRNSFPLGRILLQRRQITEAQLDSALSEQARTGQRLGQILIAAGAVSPFQLAAALAEQQGLLAASRDVVQGVLPRPRLYEVREVVDDESYSLYSSRNFLDATDLAFAVLHEWEPKEIHVVCIAQDDEELCWKYPPPEHGGNSRFPP
jgi:hypothetical protein